MNNITKEELRAFKFARDRMRNECSFIKDMVEATCIYSGISQRRLGQLLGQSSSGYICNIIAGRRKMGIKQKETFANLLKLNQREKNALYEG